MVNVKMVLFWNVIKCSLVDRYVTVLEELATSIFRVEMLAVAAGFSCTLPVY
jgi:hypothetical protein